MDVPRISHGAADGGSDRAAVRPSPESGYAMAALLVGMSVMAIIMSAAMPVWSTAAKRMKEDELVFRGEQYAHAIALYQRKYANALPPTIDVLVNDAAVILNKPSAAAARMAVTRAMKRLAEEIRRG